MAGEAERAFMEAGLLDRAATLLMRSFRDPFEPVSRNNVARGISNAITGGSSGMILGSVVPSGGREVQARALRSVSEAWQVLERAGLICRDLEQTSGDWWILTEAGERVRDSSDVVSSIRNALAGS